MTSKSGKNKNVAHEAIAECVTDVLTTFDFFCDLLLNRRTATWNLFVLYNNETNYFRQTFQFYLKIFQRKPAFAQFGEHEKSDLTQSIQNEAISLVSMRSKE